MPISTWPTSGGPTYRKLLDSPRPSSPAVAATKPLDCREVSYRRPHGLAQAGKMKSKERTIAPRLTAMLTSQAMTLNAIFGDLCADLLLT